MEYIEDLHTICLTKKAYKYRDNVLPSLNKFQGYVDQSNIRQKNMSGPGTYQILKDYLAS